MGLEGMVAHKFITSALTVRMFLSKNTGNQVTALNALMEGKQEEERACVEAIIEACIRTSEEYNIRWSKNYNHLMEDMLDDEQSSKGKGCGCIIISIIGLVLLLTVLYLCFWR